MECSIMAKRKSTGKSPARRRAYTSPARRRTYHKKSDSAYIPSAGATIGLVYANMQPIRTAVSSMSIDGLKSAAREAVQPEQLKKTAIYTIGGAVAGEAIKKFAPNVIKKPVGKVAKKIPKVI